MVGGGTSRWTVVVGLALTALTACGAPGDDAAARVTGTGQTSAPASTAAPTVPETTVPTAAPDTSPGTTAPGAPAGAALQPCSDVPDLITEVIGDDPAGLGPDPVFLGVIQTYASEHPDTFAGLWLDRETAGTMVLAFTDEPSGHRAALAARRPQPDDVQPVQPPVPITDDRPIGEWGIAFDVVQATYTEAELVEATNTAIELLADAGFADVGAGSNAIKNRVTLIMAGPLSTDDAATVAAALGPAVPLDMVCLEGAIVESPPPTIAPGTPLDVIALPGPDGTYPPDTPVECGGIGFELGALQAPTPVEAAEPGLADVIAAWVDGPMGDMVPDEGRFVLAHDDRTATLAVVVDGALSYVFAELGRNGWIWSGSGGGGPCVVRRQLPAGLGGVEWVLDPAFPAPGPDATELHVLVTETACTGGAEPGERLLGPQVVETDTAVLIAFATIPLIGAQACPGNPPTPVTVTLTAPLGRRQVLDGLAVAPLLELLAP